MTQDTKNTFAALMQSATKDISTTLSKNNLHNKILMENVMKVAAEAETEQPAEVKDAPAAPDFILPPLVAAPMIADQPRQDNIVAAPAALQLVDYSEKAFAIVGDTKPIKEQLKQLGGRYNPGLKCGAGWIFSKKRIAAVKQALSL